MTLQTESGSCHGDSGEVGALLFCLMNRWVGKLNLIKKMFNLGGLFISRQRCQVTNWVYKSKLVDEVFEKENNVGDISIQMNWIQ